MKTRKEFLDKYGFDQDGFSEDYKTHNPYAAIIKENSVYSQITDALSSNLEDQILHKACGQTENYCKCSFIKIKNY